MTFGTLQNRVDPWGRLCADANRGALMGNRGILHDDENRIVRPWAHKAWVTCLLEFKSIKRAKPFSQGNYSELFFIDEATAFAAGHRPCAYCQRERHLKFKEAWVRANQAEKTGAPILIADVDRLLHAERARKDGAKVTFDAALCSLPVGAMFEHQDTAYLVTPHGFLPWSFSGYGGRADMDTAATVAVLTPRSVVQAFAHGFEPKFHSSANA